MKYEPDGYRKSRRSVVMAPNGMVATSQPLAAQAGIDILKAGGNAIDAAIAVDAVLGVVEPMSCGIGGDLFAIVYEASTGQLHGLNASGRAPYAATIEFFKKQAMDFIPDRGPLAWSVPGCVDGWESLRRRFGHLTLDQILSPAVGYAMDGFPVSDIIARDWASAESLLSNWTGSGDVYLPNGHAPHPGGVFKNPDLGNTYLQVADQGRDAFYLGNIAEKIVACSEETGGLLTASDLQDHAATWDTPMSTCYRGYDLYELPPSGQGIAALQMVNILEGFDMASMGHNSADALHCLIEAKKLSYADRAKYYADPEFSDIPVQELISKSYADSQRVRINPRKASDDVPPGNPLFERNDTAYMTVVDKDRNAVSFIQSLFMGFGSGVVPPGTGFPMQNRGQLFSLDETHANALVPHKRPFHTIIPAMVMKNGKPLLSFGLMGGDMQPQGHTQIMCNLIDFGMDIQEAGDADRFNHSGSATPTGLPMDADGGQVATEPGVSDDVIQELSSRGHTMVRTVHGFGGYQAIMIDPDTEMLHGASEPRKDGCAIGY